MKTFDLHTASLSSVDLAILLANARLEKQELSKQVNINYIIDLICLLASIVTIVDIVLKYISN